MKITKYATRCWAKAAMEIILAFIILVFGMQAFNQLPGMALLLDLFWFLYAIFWFGIISLLIVAFANIAKSLLTVEPTLTYNEIDAKLEQLEKKLGGDWVLGEPEMAPPPVPPEDILPRKRTVAIVLSLVAALMIASIFIGNMALGFGTSMGGGSTPEETFDMFIQRINEHDFVGAVDYTILRFIMTPEDAADILRGIFHNGEDFSVTVNSRAVIEESDIPQELKDSMTSIINMIKNDYSVDIEDWCAIEFAFVINIAGDSPHEVSDMIPLVKIQGSWYLMIPPEGEEGGGSTPEETFDAFIQNMNENDFGSAVDYTILRFVLDTQNATERLREIFHLVGVYNFNIIVTYRNVMNEMEIPQELKDNITDAITIIENEYGRSVEEWRVIEFVIIINIAGDSPHEISDMIPLVKIQGSWYLMIPPEEEGGGEVSSIYVFERFIERMNAHDVQGALD